MRRLTTQQYNDSGIISLFAGATAIGYQDEADNFVFTCIINP